MNPLTYSWPTVAGPRTLELVPVPTTGGRPYLFGEGANRREINVSSFLIATVPVTQALWEHVMGPGSIPACHRGDTYPLEYVSWDEIRKPDGFLSRINSGPIHAALAGHSPGTVFRLPTETEWEYAARGGPHWTDGFRFSGSDDVESAAWYQLNSLDQTHDVAQKAPNQLGLFDMSGNVWEWCEDCHTPDVAAIPADGRPHRGPDDDHVLRGGCFHNWAIHCTVSKRYAIDRNAHDGCIGFRLVLAMP